jgi:hypothetical protein
MKAPRQSAPQSPEAALPDTPAAATYERAGTVDAEQRHALIERAAYLLAETRGFAPGEELDDWLAAEAEVERQLSETKA